MKHRLFLTFIAAFTLIIVLGAAVNIAFVAVSSRRAYTSMVRAEDRLQAERTALIAEAYFAEFGTLEGIEALFEMPDMFSSTRNNRHFGEHMMGRPPSMGPLTPPVLILSSDGRPVADPGGILKGRPAEDLDKTRGVPIDSGQGNIGWVFAGSMLGPALEARENEFLELIRRSALISSLSTAVVAILLGGLLFRSIARPVEALATASRAIARGDLGARVGIKRTDELGELISQFNRMAESLESSEEWKRRIISDSAHELRTPVALIQGELEMILEGVYTADRERIESLYRETERMARIIGELGELAAAEGGRIQLNFENCELKDLINEAAGLFTAGALKKAVAISVQGEFAPVRGDSQKIIQVLRNLIGNALKAVPEGGVIDIYSLPEDGGENLRLCVDDSGPGIPEEMGDKVFQRFFRLDTSRSRESGGTGLGLAISSQIVQLHGGRMWVDSGRNGGARLNIVFPVQNSSLHLT